MDLLENKLNFNDVKVYNDYSKSQVIEKLDLIQCEADDFEEEKNKTDYSQENEVDQRPRQDWLLVVAIVNIGYMIPWMTSKK